MNIFVFHFFVILNIILFSAGILVGAKFSHVLEERRHILNLLYILYSSMFFAFLMFLVNPLHVYATGIDLIISFLSGYIISSKLIELIH